MNHTELQMIASRVAAIPGPGPARDEAIRYATESIDAALAGETGTGWLRELGKLRDTLVDGRPRFTVIAQGNGKLPFLTFSALPGSAGLCPGAGDCLSYCYSFRAWRYPAAFCRQAQNTFLMTSGDGIAAICDALDSLQPPDGDIDFRLYVDGDFRSADEVMWWMDILRFRPWLRAYGYSKSWAQILEADELFRLWNPTTPELGWPPNYLLNLSSGSVHGEDMRERMRALPITRGEFVAVPIGRKVTSADHGERTHQAALRSAYRAQGGTKAFTCPGKCGDCTPKGHACGSEKFRGIPVIIAVH